MEYRQLGCCGLKVSALSYGAWVTFAQQMSQKEATRCLQIAYEAGVNFFDNAEVYAHGEAESIMGRALHAAGWPRDSYLVSSKSFFGSRPDPLPTQRGLSRKHLVESCHQALQRMQLDYLDLFFCHRADAEVPMEEIVHAMHDLILQGKVLYWGTSEWSAVEIAQAHGVAQRYGWHAPVVEQPQYNMLVRERVEREYAPLYREFGMGTTIWSPLRSGMLTGKYNEGMPENSRVQLPSYGWLKESFQSPKGQRQLEATRLLSALGAELGVSMAHLAIAWCLKNPRVSTVILGASRVEQLEENLRAQEVVAQLDEAVMQRIEECLAVC